MVDRKEFPAFRFVIGCALGAYIAGEHLEFFKAPAQQTLRLATAPSTGSISAVTLNLSTFAKIDAPPPLVPPGDRQDQG
jgi:hypothetical protein